jgi:riboflavin synthase
MFTGLVEAIAEVRGWQPSADGARLQLAVAWPDAELSPLGASVAVNGCCLTVVAQAHEGAAELLDFELSHETLARTIFATTVLGQRCNVERALRLGDRLGGHLVTGHVDGTGQLVACVQRGDCWDLRYRLPSTLEPEVVLKGSIAIDGVSLTVNGTPPGHVDVTIVPHTAAHTQLLDGGEGKSVHLETDVLAKHVRRLLTFAPHHTT